jgi:murein L,D-transpeptidase YafK
MLDHKNPNSRYLKSIHINYPNAQDRATAHKLGVDPGGHIMVHGQPNELGWLRMFSQFVNWTDGCIALTGKDMQAVWGASSDYMPRYSRIMANNCGCCTKAGTLPRPSSLA